MPTIEKQLAERLKAAFASAAGRPADAIDPLLRPATDPKFGDYQSNAAMALAKQVKSNPRELAQQAVDAADLADLCENVEIAGPGFINLRLKREFIAHGLVTLAGDEHRGIARVSASERKTVVVDYSSPNVAKEMHVGHIRSTVIGDAICRLLESQGHKVISDNHVGDWGLQFGMVILGYKQYGDDQALERDPVAEMERLYRKVNALAEADPNVKQQARDELRKLQTFGSENIAIWSRLTDASGQYFEGIYERLNIRDFDLWKGEADYRHMLEGVIGELSAAEIAEASEGALVVFFRDNPELAERAPMIIRKQDEGYLYATTDLATLKWRLTEMSDGPPDEIIYVTDARQKLHFQQLFAAFRKWQDSTDQDWGRLNPTLKHVSFGTIQGPDGKPFKTRTGETVRLTDLLDEAEQRALAIVQEKNPDLPEDQKKQVAKTVGIGAIKYFDLSNNRLSDYRFDWDQMLALTGNTAPYLQYAYARVQSIFRKGAAKYGMGNAECGTEDAVAASPGEFQIPNSEFRISSAPALAEPAERELAKHLLQYGEAIDRVLEDYRPNLLCDYLYELARRFSGFYTDCPVLDSDEPTRSERLLLCYVTAAVLKHGLGLLGIDVLEQM